MSKTRNPHKTQHTSHDIESKETAWTSFDDSPIHTSSAEPIQHAGMKIMKNEDAWTTFSDNPSDNDASSMVASRSRVAVIPPQEGNLHPMNQRIAKVKPVQQNDHALTPGRPVPQVQASPNTPVQMNIATQAGMHLIGSPNVVGHTPQDIQHHTQYPLYKTPNRAPQKTDIHLNTRHQSIPGTHSISHSVLHSNLQSTIPSISAAAAATAAVHHTGPHTNDMNKVHNTAPVDVSTRILHREHSGDDHHLTDPRVYDVDVNGHDSWCITDEQRSYYTNQFTTMQPDLGGKIDGQSARNFFTKSRLPIPELSHIWELSDIDQDGHLTLGEFCAAFHLVVARKNGYDLPPVLPQSLVPVLVDFRGTVLNKDSSGNESVENSVPAPSPTLLLPQKSHVHHDNWETFSDRASSSTTLANFDQSVENTEDLVHPIPLHITPSRQEEHATRMRSNKSPPKSTDEGDSSPPADKPRVPVAHRSLTNPYGSLTNDSSEPDNTLKKNKPSQDRRRFPSSSSTSPGESVNVASPVVLRPRTLSVSSNSSVATSERSSEIEQSFTKPENNHSDQEHSDWSSRPLRPRSGSDTSIDSPPLRGVAFEQKMSAPTPPPRPYQHASKSGDTVHSSNQAAKEELLATAPTPPPRPQQSAPPKSAPAIVVEQETFADFSQFETKSAETVSADVPDSGGPVTNVATEQSAQDGSRPVPAPRQAKEAKARIPSESDVLEKSPDSSGHKSAPAKPPRSRILSAEASKPDQITSTHFLVTDESQNIQECPEQEKKRTKAMLQQSIRDLKLRNNQLTRLNAELQQELKDVMQSRITVEMSIHQLRPFSH